MKADSARIIARIRENIKRVIVGNDKTVDFLLCALIAKGHVLLEDVPGTGKTLLAKSLAKSLDLSFSRIQFTPDLLPSDVTGLSVFNAASGEFEFKPGAVFTNVLLADEINRATPRAQSSLLECMEERQVTSDGVTRVLEEPFIVVATQNPVETQGTFPLPEAQIDRFIMRLRPGYPTTDGSMQIIDRFLSGDPLAELSPVASRDELLSLQTEGKAVHVAQPVRRYAADLVERTRAMDQVLLGVSPRGMLALVRAAQAYALLHGRDYVLPDDIKILGEPVLSHRIVLRGLNSHTRRAEEIISEALSRIQAPTENAEEDA